MRPVILSVVFLFLPIACCAQKVKSVSGEFTYYAEASMSLNDAKRSAIENARLQALANEFGTHVSQSTEQIERSADGQESSFFMQLNSSEVKGEWLEDTMEPQCEVVEILTDMIVLKAKISGKARAVSNEAVDFEALVLRNGTEARFADAHFRDGDDLFMLFRAPVDGYVAVYLIDEHQTAFCLLPYQNNADGQMPVRRNKEYVFFAPNRQGDDEVDELTMNCVNGTIEHNQIYVIFSPNVFHKALDNHLDDTLPRQLLYRDFSQWLSKCRKRDPKMGVKIMHIKITN
ncbi:MAG: DUF4384 domain-containing protein [Bacteroidaceae bacterium]|nr:DUF4384 domain-containing protein [Bacteroidaceae bacterium]